MLLYSFILPGYTSAHMLIGLQAQQCGQLPLDQMQQLQNLCSASLAQADTQHCATKRWDESTAWQAGHTCTSAQAHVTCMLLLLGWLKAAANLLSPQFNAVCRLMAHVCCRLRI